MAITVAEQVTYSVTYRGADGEGWAIARVDGYDVGTLRWNYLAEPPVVVDVSVDEPYRCQGIATGLFQTAKANESELVHSETLTGDGRAFREAMEART